MTRVRLSVAAFAATLVGLATAAAAPVPKDALRPNPVPDLKAVLALVGKAVENEQWPTKMEEKQLRDSARAILERTVKAAGQKERKLPVEFVQLVKDGMPKRLKNGGLENYLIAGNVRVTGVKDSVILASGNV